jgi:hypothetical protein
MEYEATVGVYIHIPLQDAAYAVSSATVDINALIFSVGA